MIERVSWGGWPNCYRLTDGRSEVIATSDVGPRIVRYGFLGGQNFLLERPEEQGTKGEADFVDLQYREPDHCEPERHPEFMDGSASGDDP